jgi:hypothetical protein
VAVARAYTSVYLGLTHRFARGVGLADHALYTLSVQYLNRDLFVKALVERHSLLPTLASAVRDTVAVAQSSSLTPLQHAERAAARARKADAKLERRGTVGLGSIFGSRARAAAAEEEEEEEAALDESSSDEDDGEVEAALEALADGHDPSRRWVPTSEAATTAARVAGQKASFGGLLQCDHPLLVHRRYSPALADLKCVLNVGDMARRFCVDPPSDHDDAEDEADSGGALSSDLGAGKRRLRRRRQRDCLGAWCEALALAQGMHPEMRRARGPHVEFESRSWMHAFNLNISLTSAFDFMTAWLKKATQIQDQAFAVLFLDSTALLGVSVCYEHTRLRPSIT